MSLPILVGEQVAFGIDIENLWSHAAIVISSELFPIKNAKPGQLYIWESAYGNSSDVERGIEVKGVQIRELRSRIIEYDSDPNTKVAWAQLKINPLDKRPDESSDDFNSRVALLKGLLATLHEKYGDAKYTTNICHMMGAAFPCCLRLNCCCCCDTSDELFCSELVALVWQSVGILSKNLIPSRIMPMTLLGHKLKVEEDNNASNIVAESPVHAPVLLTRDSSWRRVKQNTVLNTTTL